jgi:hypothetical protein
MTRHTREARESSRAPDQRVDLLGLDVVHLLHGLLDLLLVGAHVDDEDERVVVLDLLHGGLGGERVLEHLVVVELVAAGRAEARVLGHPGALEGLGAVEGDGRALLAPQLLHGLGGGLERLRRLGRLGRLRVGNLRGGHCARRRAGHCCSLLQLRRPRACERRSLAVALGFYSPIAPSPLLSSVSSIHEISVGSTSTCIGPV